MSKTNPLPSLSDAAWLSDRRTKLVFHALESAGFDIRAVGGAVRNTLFGLPVGDIDFATTAPPDASMRAAREADLQVVPTGYDHGTVTVVVDSTPFEVTTLRRDVETDGRHAKVAYTDDWTEDARRRDFTINALYCDRHGRIYDPVSGIADVSAQRVRFIGDAGERIREDYLRILRFFRFSAAFGDGTCDDAGLAACTKLRTGLDRLSGERIGAELHKLLIAPFAGAIVTIMDRAQILARLFEPVCHVGRFSRLVAIDDARGATGDPIQRLAALALTRTADALWLRDRLRLSAREFARLAAMASLDDAVKAEATEHAAKCFVYRNGAETFRDAVLLSWAGSNAPADNPAWRERLDLPNRWQAPQFPLTGADVLAVGITPGPKVGAILDDVERWWLEAGFPGDRTVLLAELGRAAKVTKS